MEESTISFVEGTEASNAIVLVTEYAAIESAVREVSPGGTRLLVKNRSCRQGKFFFFRDGKRRS